MYKSLQAGRAIAAILVVLYHLGGNIAKEKYFGIKMFSVPFSFGGSGVEFFFVLSGFIILAAHRDDIFKPHKFLNYLKKRFIRIYPSYWIIFLSVFFLALMSETTRYSVPHEIQLIIKSLLLVPQNKLVVGGTGSPVLGVAWTLQYEMFFYFFFAFLILSKWLSVIFFTILLFIYINYAGTLSPAFPYSFLSQDYILLFAMGMIVYLISKSKRVVVVRPAYYSITGLIMFLYIAMDSVLSINYFMEWNIILYGFASSLIIFGLVRAEDNGQAFGAGSWMQMLGNSSYALYLIHVPIISVLCKLSVSLHLNDIGVLGAIISYFYILIACLISSIVFRVWIEKPIVLFLRNLYLPSAK